MHAGKDKARMSASHFDSCLINNRVRWHCVSYVISGKKGLGFLGIGSAKPEEQAANASRGHSVQQGTRASTVTCTQAYAFLSPVET